MFFLELYFFYAFLYYECTPPDRGQYNCDEVCEKFQNISMHILKDSTVLMAIQCSTSQYCITVKDSITLDWTALADSACTYIKNEGLQNYNVNIIGYYNQDTLINQKCP